MSEEARNKTLKQEQNIMFMDSSCLDDDQKAYVSAMRAQILKARMTHLWVGFQVVSQEVRAELHDFCCCLLYGCPAGFLEKPLANLLFGYYYDEIECSYISDKHI